MHQDLVGLHSMLEMFGCQGELGDSLRRTQTGRIVIYGIGPIGFRFELRIL